MRLANIISSVVLLLVAAYVIYESVAMAYTVDNVPGPGFIPLWTGVIIALISGFMLWKNAVLNRPESQKSPGFNKVFWRNSGIVIGGSAAALMLIKAVGMLMAIGLLTGFLSWGMGTKSKLTNLALTLVTPIVFWLLFEKALEVNFPKGFLGF